MNRPLIGWASFVLAVIVAFYALDVTLARVETTELHNEAHALYLTGNNLLSMGHAAGAVEPLQRAYTLERKNREYQLSYAEALTGAGLYEEASTLLHEAIAQAPNEGRANLLLARLARAQHDFANEAPYYHRAIYGVWHRDAAAYVNQTRLEWIKELAAHGDSKLLLGELLPLEAETNDARVLTEAAHYYLDAGSPSRAADLYRKLLAGQPDNAGLEKGLGEAETAAGRYAAAQHAFLRAFQAAPADSSIRHEMEVSSALSAIDPTPRRLPSKEKYERSNRILKLVRDSLSACGSATPEADATLAINHPDTSNEAAEQVLQQAELLWKDRPQRCTFPELLAPLMKKLAQL